MNNYALIQNGIVAEILPKMLDGVDIADRYPARLISEFCVECPDEVRAGWAYEGGQFAPPPGPSLEDAKAVKLAEIITKADAVKAALLVKYSDLEQQSFPNQLQEATAWTADSSALTPTLSILAGKNGITVADLAPRVLAKASALIAAGAPIIGQSQVFRARLDAIASDGTPAGNAAAIAAVNAIEVVYTPPAT